MKVLVTDGDNRAALAVTRSLGRAGHEVVVGAKASPSLAQTSRYCVRGIVYPDPVAEPDRFTDAVVDLVRASAIDCVIPIADVTTFLVTEHRSRFGPACAVPFAGADIVARAADKVDVIKTAASLGIPVPRSIVVQSTDQLPDDLAFPVVIKPWRSRIRTHDGWASTSVSYADSMPALARDLRGRPAYEFPVMLQERIEGPGVGVFACYDNGQAVALFSHRRLRERPPWGGVSVLCESVALPAPAHDYATRLLEAIGWQGVAMVEFKVDRRDGQPKLMEINGRFWGSLQLAIDAGVDFPTILLQSISPGPVPAQPAYRVGVRNRWLWGDFDSLLQTLRPRGGPADLRKGRLRTAAAFLRFWSPRLYYDNPKWDDPKPFAFETGERLRAISAYLWRNGAEKDAVRDPATAAASRPDVFVAAGLADTGLDAAAWNSLASSSATNTIFQTHQWTRSWMDAYCDRHQPLLLVATGNPGAAAVAPLMLDRSESHVGKVVRFIGDGRADYCDLLVPDETPERTEALLGALLDRTGWDVIDLRNIPGASRTPGVAARLAAMRGYRARVLDQFVCPTLVIRGREPEADRILSKPSVRRAQRALSRAGAIRVVHATTASAVEPQLAAFFDQHVARWRESSSPSLFVEEANRVFYRLLTRSLDDTGWLLFSTIELDGQPAAFHYGFEYDGVLVWYKPSFDPALAHLSPGTVTVRELLRYAVDRRCRELDFTVGDETFKRRFTNHERKTVRVLIFRDAFHQLRWTAGRVARKLRHAGRSAS